MTLITSRAMLARGEHYRALARHRRTGPGLAAGSVCKPGHGAVRTSTARGAASQRTGQAGAGIQSVRELHTEHGGLAGVLSEDAQKGYADLGEFRSSVWFVKEREHGKRRLEPPRKNTGSPVPSLRSAMIKGSLWMAALRWSVRGIGLVSAGTVAETGGFWLGSGGVDRRADSLARYRIDAGAAHTGKRIYGLRHLRGSPHHVYGAAAIGTDGYVHRRSELYRIRSRTSAVGRVPEWGRAIHAPDHRGPL